MNNIKKKKILPLFEEFNNDVRKINKWGDTMLIKAAKEQDKISALKIMDMEGVDINHKNFMGDTALKFFVIGNQIECIKKYIQKGGNVNEKMYYGYTALMLASYRGLEEIIDILLENKADITLTDNEGFNMLMHVSMTGGLGIIRKYKYLFDNDYLNKQNKWGNTALMEAAFMKQKETVKELILMGSNKEIKNIEGQTASDIALEEWLNEEVKIPEKYKNKKNNKEIIYKFIEKIQQRRAEKIKLLFKERPPEKIPLIVAIKKKDVKKTLELLKEYGEQVDWNGHTGYDWAIYYRPSTKNLEKRKSTIEKINKIFTKYGKISNKK